MGGRRRSTAKGWWMDGKRSRPEEVFFDTEWKRLLVCERVMELKATIASRQHE